jgi:hypothetical protein
MKNYMKYFLLMGLVSVASAALALDETEMKAGMVAGDEGEGVTNDQTVQPEYYGPFRHPL